METRDIFIDVNPLKRVARPAYTFVSVIPKAVQEENYWFYNISNLAYVLIAMLHVSWMVLFYNFGLIAMVQLQFLSISFYIAAIVLNRKGYHLLGMVLAVLEANFHQVAAVSMLGWSTGFQNFIPLIALLPFLKYNETWITKFSFGIGCMLCYLYMDIFMKGVPPIFPLNQNIISFLNFSNAILCFLLVALWGIVLAISYQRTVSALLKKEQELFAAEKAAEQMEILRKLEMKELDNEIFQLRNVELKNSNNEILIQKKRVEELVLRQEKTISERTEELAESNKKLVHVNKKLVELIQYNAHNLREPLARIMGGIIIVDYMSKEEYHRDVLPEIGRAAADLDIRIREVVNVADDAVTMYG